MPISSHSPTLPPSRSRQTLISFLSLWHCLFWSFYRCEIMHYVVLRAWRLASFTQHNIFKFFYVCVRASFLSTAEQSFTGWICRILFITSKWTFELLPLCLLQIVLI